METELRFTTETDLELWNQRKSQNRLICTVATLWMIYVIICQTVESRRAIEAYKQKTSEESLLEQYDYIYDGENKTLSLPDRFTNKYQNIELKEVQETTPSHLGPICTDETQLLIIVDSNPRRAQRRTQIRETWSTSSIVSKIFFVGLPDHRSVAFFQDMMIEVQNSSNTAILDVIESPGNKTMKSLGEIKWALNNCNFSYLLHVPEDFDVDVDKMVDILQSDQLKNGSVWCQTYQDHAIVRREGRWMVPMDEYFEDYFPPYCSGGHYFMSKVQIILIYL